MYKGIFWWKDQKLIAVKVKCTVNGEPLEPVSFSSKSGKNFNHKAEWEKLSPACTHRLPYNHYPRGRVEIRRDKIHIWLPPSLNREDILQTVKREFELHDALPLSVHSDGSRHYRYENGL